MPRWHLRQRLRHHQGKYRSTYRARSAPGGHHAAVRADLQSRGRCFSGGELRGSAGQVRGGRLQCGGRCRSECRRDGRVQRASRGAGDSGAVCPPLLGNQRQEGADTQVGPGHAQPGRDRAPRDRPVPVAVAADATHRAAAPASAAVAARSTQGPAVTVGATAFAVRASSFSALDGVRR